MEHRPSNLDELFKRGLGQHQETPREALWHKLDAQLAQKRSKKRSIFWIGFGSAAAVLVALFVGLALKFTPTNTQELSQNNTLANQTMVEEQTAEINEEIVADATENLPGASSIAASLNTVTKAIRTFKKAQKSIENVTTVVTQVATPENPTTNNTVATTPTVHPKTDEPKVSPIPETLAINKAKPAEKPFENNEIRTSASRSYNSVTYEAPERTQPKKGLGLLLTQVRKAKKGERIDWDRLGFKPSKLIARAENDLNSSRKTIAEEVSELGQEIK
jgi:hypothetical protein